MSNCVSFSFFDTNCSFGLNGFSTLEDAIASPFNLVNDALGISLRYEVKTLAKALTMGFHKNFPNQDLTILIYAPDKERILTAKYDVQSNSIEYQA
ncbi:MAG: hypothetical protein QNJ65_02535 [Xenococcaceae cyanobacterium MO_234.B1]|nr:hypothetical protein [Xenococcaceae cyanobacterium MO_234.B1]